MSVFFEFLTALLFAGFVLAAIFVAYVKMLKRAVNRPGDELDAAGQLNAWQTLRMVAAKINVGPTFPLPSNR